MMVGVARAFMASRLMASEKWFCAISCSRITKRNF